MTDLVISLEENPTTGYTWSYSIEPPSLLEVIDDDYMTKNKCVCGSSGIHTWKFNALKDGKVSITFIKKRNWEEEIVETIVKTYIIDGKNITEIKE